MSPSAHASTKLDGPAPSRNTLAAVNTSRHQSQGNCSNGCRCVKCTGVKQAPVPRVKQAPVPRAPRKLDPIAQPSPQQDAQLEGAKPETMPISHTAGEPAPLLLAPTSVIAADGGTGGLPPSDAPSTPHPILSWLRSWPFPTPGPTESEPYPIIGIRLTHLLAALDYAAFTTKTPIILDKSGKVDVFFAHRHSVIIECKPLVLDVFMRHTLSPASGARIIADKIRGAMQVAAFLQFRLTDSAPNFKKLADATVNEATGDITDHAAWFPYAHVFDVKAIRQDSMVAKLDPLNHPGTIRKPNDVPLVIREGFSVVVTSKFDPEDAVEFLSSSLPLDRCQFFSVTDPNA